jgi:hypothetical protein
MPCSYEAVGLSRGLTYITGRPLAHWMARFPIFSRWLLGPFTIVGTGFRRVRKSNPDLRLVELVLEHRSGAVAPKTPKMDKEFDRPAGASVRPADSFWSLLESLHTGHSLNPPETEFEALTWIAKVHEVLRTPKWLGQ